MKYHQKFYTLEILKAFCFVMAFICIYSSPSHASCTWDYGPTVPGACLFADKCTTIFPSGMPPSCSAGEGCCNDPGGGLWQPVTCSCPPVTDGVCGTANGVGSAVAPSTDLCSAGNPTAVTVSGSDWVWNCNSPDGGTNASCSAPQMINGACGAADGSNVYTAPSSSLCATGNASAVTGSGPFTWDCNGIGGGSDASCSANLSVNGVCGASHGQYFSSAPTSGFCAVGTESAIAGSNPYTWTCSGTNGGANGNCSTLTVIQGVCGPANNTPTAVAPAAGLCSTGTPSAVAGTGPFTWSCAGTGGGSNASCSAPLPPPPPTLGGACPT